MPYATDTKTARMGAVRDKLDAGSGSGVLEMLSAGGAVLCSLTLQKPSGTLSNGVLTLTGPLTGSAAATGTITQARLRDSTGVDVRTGLTVGTSGADIVLSAVTISALPTTVTINTATIQHAA